jgi:hypothetical protein
LAFFDKQPVEITWQTALSLNGAAMAMKRGAVTNWRKKFVCRTVFLLVFAVAIDRVPDPSQVRGPPVGKMSSERRWDGNNRFSDNGIFKVSAAHVNIFVIGLICIHFFIF